ncbi:ATP-binding protein [Ectopseudomonas mendocina]|uniref:histidine kinase n=1 Tax=Ectopseudomonas mendocina TaxID=300 RepID=A0ABZ2RPE7_ECTME
MSFSLRTRLMLGATALAVVFMLALLPILRSAFVIALEESIETRLSADAVALVSAARTENGVLKMPDVLPDEEFDALDTKLLGFIYDRDGNLVWQSRPTLNTGVHYMPSYDGTEHVFVSIRDDQGHEFYVYDVEIDLLRGKSAAFSVVTMQPASNYQSMYKEFTEQLYLWLGGALVVLLAMLWFGLTWGFRSLRGLRQEMDEIESGSRQSLSDQHPKELLRLTGSLNRLLESERQQRERYRNSLDDLAHSLKTPLAVLQGVGDVVATQLQNREQSQILQQQIERMSQQIDYQLQRASLRKSGLIRHRALVAPAISSVCAALDKVYREKQVTVIQQVEAQQQLPLEHGALLELLGNLLENAYRLCVSQIRVTVRNLPKACELVVEDDGPGLPERQRERILQRGVRLDVQNPGQGIGLAVVLDIVESYSGELFLETSELGGASFRMRFALS